MPILCGEGYQNVIKLLVPMKNKVLSCLHTHCIYIIYLFIVIIIVLHTCMHTVVVVDTKNGGGVVVLMALVTVIVIACDVVVTREGGGEAVVNMRGWMWSSRDHSSHRHCRHCVRAHVL